MDILIRSARPAEYEEIGELTSRAYLADGLLLSGADDPYLPVLRDVARRAAGAEVLVAEEDGQIRGAVTFVAQGPYADLAGAGEAEFRMLAVSAAARGRGAGEALVRACVERARALPDCRALVLSTQPAMRSAHRLYERLGFTRAPERDWEPIPGLTLLAYALTL
ncbi:acetyltransferase [Streptomyces albus]|uniref:Acetyltransferase n=1 Tax=Streptomyces albus (strain ATCC 21838 / DSM 41398 / FERM P-419 / JCM 4703 / NBRC 107858) TaxID=1081613 RepID=A0A0B5ELM7_STRA4|nr:acetyltransferase [Streptomyces albus]AOU76758.1 acetyltransferase [Streptomyces albus]AYN32538.1 GNAT family N-acetyltransferase [Streptomyces albus]